MRFAIKKIRNNRVIDQLVLFAMTMLALCTILRADLLITFGDTITNYLFEENSKTRNNKLKLFEDTTIPELLGINLTLSELYAIYAVLSALFIAVSTIVLGRFLNDPKKIIPSDQRPHYETMERKFYKGKINYKDLSKYRKYIADEPQTLRMAVRWIAISTVVVASLFVVNPRLDTECGYSVSSWIGRSLLACVVPALMCVLLPLIDFHIAEAFSNRVLKNRFGDSIDAGIQTFEFIRKHLNMTTSSAESIVLFNSMTAARAADLQYGVKRALEKILQSRHWALVTLIDGIKIAVCYSVIFIIATAFNGVEFHNILALLAGSCILGGFTVAWSYLWTLLFLGIRKVSILILNWVPTIVIILMHLIIVYQLRPVDASIGEYIFTFIIFSPAIISFLLFLVGLGDFSELTIKVYSWKNGSPKGFTFNLGKYLTPWRLSRRRKPFNMVAVFLASFLLEL